MNFVIIGARGVDRAVHRGVFGEVEDGKVPNARYISPRISKSKLSHLCYDVLCRRSTPLWMRCALKAPWEVNYKQVAPLLKSDEENCIVFCPTTPIFERIKKSLLRDLRRKQPDCKLALYLVDTVDRMARSNHCGIEKITDFLKQFDAVYTYNAHDAETYGYRYAELPIWVSEDTSSPETQYDVYFCGRDKNRRQLLKGVYERLKAGGATSKIVLCDKYMDAAGEDTFFTVESWRAYPEIVEETRRARCVLEILANSSTSATLRYKEAVVYNKKLLTNNPDLPKLPYYDARWMRCFEKPEDIDVAWLLKDEPVDYRYRGDFSAKHFLEMLERDLGTKSAK